MEIPKESQQRLLMPVSNRSLELETAQGGTAESLSSQNSHSGSETSATPVTGNPTHSSGLYLHRVHVVHVHTCRKNAYNAYNNASKSKINLKDHRFVYFLLVWH